MMPIKLKHLLVLLLCFSSYFCWSNPIDAEQARRYALQSGLLQTVNQSKTEKHRTIKKISEPAQSLQLAYTLHDETANSGMPLLYVFTQEAQKGYVVVSADDAVTPVIGYSTQGTFDATAMPPQLKAVLRIIGQSIAEASCKQASESQDASLPIVSRTEIKPLLKDIQWGQYAPFNSMTPVVDGYRSLTGCVATALAQIMYYHRHPQKAEGTAYYKFTDFFKPGKSVTLGSNGEYQWDSMRPAYYAGNPYTTEEAKAVGLLLFEVGAACSMQYSAVSSNSSGANALKALRSNFNYPKAQLIRRMNKTAREWEDIIYNELAAQRPVYLDGVSVDYGHAFVCDGYDGKGYYHINWGWNGHANGYFNFSLLSPITRGTGSSGKDAFVVDLQAIVGITPPAKEYTPQPSYKILAKMLTKAEGYNQTDPKFDIRGVRLEEYDDIEAEFSLGVKDADGRIINVGVPSAWYISKEYTYNKIPVRLETSLLPNGSFRLFPIFSPKGTTQWKEISVGRYFNNAITVSNINGTFNAEETRSDIKLSSKLDKTYVFVEKKNTLTFSIENQCETAYSSFVSVYFSNENPSSNGAVDKALVKKNTISIHLEPGEKQEYIIEYIAPTDVTECYASLTYDPTNGLSDEDNIIPNTIQSVYHLQIKDPIKYAGKLSVAFEQPSYSIEKDSPLNAVLNVKSEAVGGYKGSFSYMQLFVMSKDKNSVVHRYNEFEVLLEKGQKKAIHAGGKLHLDEGEYMLVVTKNSHDGNNISYEKIAEVPLTILPEQKQDNPTTYIPTVSDGQVRMQPVISQGVLYINNVTDVRTIEVYDISGRIVADAAASTTVNIAHLNEGPYIVKVTTVNGIESIKILNKR